MSYGVPLFVKHVGKNRYIITYLVTKWGEGYRDRYLINTVNKSNISTLRNAFDVVRTPYYSNGGMGVF